MAAIRSSHGIAFRVVNCLAVFPFASLLTALAPVYASDQPEYRAAAEEFVLKEQALWDQRRQGYLSDKDWEMQYTRFIESEAERLQGLMPGILETLGKRLGYRSEKDLRLEK